jgi:hypothetical protein
MTAEVQVEHELQRFLTGTLGVDDAAALAARAGYASFSDLCEAELPELLPGLRLDRATVRGRLDEAAAGRLALDALRAWAEEVATILDRHRLGLPRSEQQRIIETLALVEVAADARIFRNRAPVLRVIGEASQALGRRAAAPVSSFYGDLFHDQPELHLHVRRVDDASECDHPDGQDEAAPGFLPPRQSFAETLGLERLDLDAGLDRRWMREGEPGPGGEPEAGKPQSSTVLLHADVVALSGPWTPGARVADYEWVVAFSVATRTLVADDPQPAEQDASFLEKARAIAPNFDLVKRKPEARRDIDGVLELVLDAPSIGAAELQYAAKLFALVHRIGRVTLEGQRVRTIAPPPVQRPGPAADPA